MTRVEAMISEGYGLERAEFKVEACYEMLMTGREFFYDPLARFYPEVSFPPTSRGLATVPDRTRETFSRQKATACLVKLPCAEMKLS
jgi:hypothetical protein